MAVLEKNINEAAKISEVSNKQKTSEQPPKHTYNFRENTSYELLDVIVLEGKPYQIYYSLLPEDSKWDEFVESVKDSLIFQLSGWVKVKQKEGWEFLRVVYVNNNQIIAGYQMLVKKSKLLGKIGYLNQAPVIDSSDANFIKRLLSDMKLILKSNNITAVVINPPTSPSVLLEKMEYEFQKFYTSKLINSEAEIDLEQDEQTLLNNMTRMRRQNIRKGEKYHFEIKPGNENDLESFFNLMTATTKRHNVNPNPPSLESVQMIWDYYHNKKKILNLYKFYINDSLISVILAFEYQDVFIPWKYGWSGEMSSYKPNDVFHWELLKIAKKKGFKKYNLGGIDFSVADKFLKRIALNEREIKSSTFFKMGFGCYIKKLPPSFICFSNPLLRFFYKVYSLIA